MGRRRTVNRDLPARLYLKRDGYYYRDLNSRETKVADYRMIALRTEPPTAPTDYLSRPATPVTN